MESQGGRPAGSPAEPWIGLALCGAVVLGWVAEQLLPNRLTYAQIFAPEWLPLAAAGVVAVGMAPLEDSSPWLRARQALRWSGLLLMVWAANGLPLDVLRVVGLIPLGLDWPGLATRALALADAVVIARPLLALPTADTTVRATWYGYVAFALALPYPVLRTHWALGGTLGLQWSGAAGEGFVPWLASIPWLVAAALSLFLVSPPRWMPRRLLLSGGWAATAIVAMIGPSACWVLVNALVNADGFGPGGIDGWVVALFYVSWLLWAIAAAAATRSYQVRSAPVGTSPPA